MDTGPPRTGQHLGGRRLDLGLHAGQVADQRDGVGRHAATLGRSPCWASRQASTWSHVSEASAAISPTIADDVERM